jgi:hypothetical protein
MELGRVDIDGLAEQILGTSSAARACSGTIVK